MLRRWIPHSPTSVTVAAAAIALGLLVPLAACSSDTGSSSATTPPSSSADPTAPTEPPIDLNATTTTTIGPAQLSIRTTALGDILVDADGMTVYTKVTGPPDGCTGACLDAWPAVHATSVKVGDGLDATLFTVVDPNAVPATTSTTGAADATDSSATGETTTTSAAPAEGVVSVGGRLLYRFVGDAVPGDTTGQGFNATFFVVLADGTLVQPTTTTTTTTAP